MSVEKDNSVGAAASVGVKREAAEMSSKKPRDERLRECFAITIGNDGKESVSCRYCPNYNKILQKFNPTKAREHLTNSCSGADEQLKQTLLSTTQAAKRLLLKEADGSSTMVAVQNATAGTPTATEASASYLYKTKGRTSLAYVSFYTDGTSLDVTASVVTGKLMLCLVFPTNQLQLNFDAQKNSEGAAVSIDGFMNTTADASWTAAMYSMTSEGTREGPHCRWPLGTDSMEEGMARVDKVQQILKTMTMS